MRSVTFSSMGLALAMFVGSPFVKGDVPNVYSYVQYCAGDQTCSAQAIASTLVTGTYQVKSGNTVTGTGNYGTLVIVDAVTGDLDFLYQFEPLSGTGTGDDVISQVSMFDFGGFTTGMGFDTVPFFSNMAPGSRAPTSVVPGGASVDFNFNPDVTGNTISDLLIIKTNAHFYTTGDFGFQDGTVGSVSAFAPSAVPEPTSILLFGGALALACSAIRRKLHSA
jgi:hypothetical protein